jgi:ferrochelatase
MGGPSTLDEVGPFLSRLFADGDLIPLPFQSMIAPWIARRRTPKIKEQYAMIGGGSPIKHWTEQQGHHLTNWLNKNCSSMGTFSSYVGFRYAAPLVSDAVARMKADGIDSAIALSLYPQYSCSTTGSSLNELYRQIQAQKTDMSWSVIDRWATHSGLINTFASHIRSSLEEYPEEERKDVVLIFSAHSLPMSVVNRGGKIEV